MIIILYGNATFSWKLIQKIWQYKRGAIERHYDNTIRLRFVTYCD